jgi:GTP-binding protein YchF
LKLILFNYKVASFIFIELIIIMSLKCGIVGLPNVGKSTLFNALTSSTSAEAANFPFCTIEPNVGAVAVPDMRLDNLGKLFLSKKVIPTSLEFVDIAGLVAGASKGEGLGNKFLANIREVDSIIHMVRCFADDNITHVSGNIDSLRDIEIIETELMLADLESLTKRLPNMEKKARSGDKDLLSEIAIIKDCIKLLEEGKPTRLLELDDKALIIFKRLQLLTNKKLLFVCNVAEDEVKNGNAESNKVAEYAKSSGAVVVNISAKIEEDISSLETIEEKQEFLAELGLVETGLSRIIKSAYQLLDLITFFTAGPSESRAWTVKNNALAPQAAGVIHSDFERGFICAETVSYNDLQELGSEKNAKDQGKLRQEGKSYLVKDGDVFHFKFNV